MSWCTSGVWLQDLPFIDNRHLGSIPCFQRIPCICVVPYTTTSSTESYHTFQWHKLTVGRQTPIQDLLHLGNLVGFVYLQTRSTYNNVYGYNINVRIGNLKTTENSTWHVNSEITEIWKSDFTETCLSLTLNKFQHTP